MFFFFSSRRRHTRCSRDWSSDVCSSDLQREASSTLRLLAGRASRRDDFEAGERQQANVRDVFIVDLDAVVADGKAARRLLYHQVTAHVFVFELGAVYLEDGPDGLSVRILQDEAPDEAKDIEGRLEELDDDIDRRSVRRERI